MASTSSLASPALYSAALPVQNNALSGALPADKMSGPSSSRTVVPQWQMRIIHYQASLRSIQPPTAYPHILLPSQPPPLSYASSAASSADDTLIESHVSSASDTTPVFEDSCSFQRKLCDQSSEADSSVPSSNASPTPISAPLSFGPHSRVSSSSQSANGSRSGSGSGSSSTHSNSNTEDTRSAFLTPSLPTATLPSSYYEPDEELIPPENFAMVSTHIYRSSFPRKKNFPFLASLGLKSVVSLVLEEYPGQNLKFFEQHGVQFFQFGIPGNKEPFIQIPDDIITNALVTMLDTRNYPMLVHCNKGKHRTGCLVGCFRKLQKWAATSIFDEYLRFAFPKSRSMDQQFIELYDTSDVWKCVDRAWLPPWVDGLGI